MKAIRQLITAGFIDQVAIRADLCDRPDLRGTKFATCKNVAYRAMGIGEPVFIHPTSVLFPNPPPTFVCFQDVVRTSKPWMKSEPGRISTVMIYSRHADLTIVNPSWLHVLGPTLCTFSTKKQTAGSKLITSTSVVSIPHFGPEGWELPPIKGRI
jgi:ATP-dependent RNA helicase DHX37/DHR1